MIANSSWLAARMPRAPDAIVDCGVDLDLFAPRPRGDDPWPHFLCIGSLTPRKQVVALADAFSRLGEGRLTFLGDGPLRSALEGRPGVHLAGRFSLRLAGIASTRAISAACSGCLSAQ